MKLVNKVNTNSEANIFCDECNCGISVELESFNPEGMDISFRCPSCDVKINLSITLDYHIIGYED